MMRPVQPWPIFRRVTASKTLPSGRLPVSVAVQSVVVVTADPLHPLVGQMWYRQDTHHLCIRSGPSTTLSVTLS